MAVSTRPPISPGLRMAIDFGPLAVFFVVNMLAGGPAIARVFASTAAFMVATATAMIVSRWKAGHISPMLWITGALVLVFGGLTLYFHDQRFVQMKPTIVYGLFAAALGFGVLTDRPMLQSLLEAAYPGLSRIGWRKLTFNWMLFFVAMAVLNEVVRARFSYDFWVGFKLWGAVPLTLLFAVANIPMMTRHGLELDTDKVEIPPEG